MSRLLLTEERYEEIKEIVVQMYERYHVSRLPINGFKIASNMGIKIVPYSIFGKRMVRLLLKESKDGFFIIKDGKYTIYYNNKRPAGRIHHTIMHELGHIMLGHLEDSQLAEIEARFFAKYALAPPVLIHALHINSPEEVEKVFGVSFEAAKYAFNYFKKWLTNGAVYYTAYEEKTIELFKGVL